jgi:hypothetical protein
VALNEAIYFCDSGNNEVREIQLGSFWRVDFSDWIKSQKKWNGNKKLKNYNASTQYEQTQVTGRLEMGTSKPMTEVTVTGGRGVGVGVPAK